MGRRLQRRSWIAIAAVVSFALGMIAVAASARHACEAAVAGAVPAAGECCAAVETPNTPAEDGAQACAMPCGASGCALVIALDTAAAKTAGDQPAAAPAVAYAGWSPSPAAPPPRRLILA